MHHVTRQDPTDPPIILWKMNSLTLPNLPPTPTPDLQPLLCSPSLWKLGLAQLETGGGGTLSFSVPCSCCLLSPPSPRALGGKHGALSRSAWQQAVLQAGSGRVQRFHICLFQLLLYPWALAPANPHHHHQPRKKATTKLFEAVPSPQWSLAFSPVYWRPLPCLLSCLPGGMGVEDTHLSLGRNNGAVHVEHIHWKIP